MWDRLLTGKTEPERPRLEPLERTPQVVEMRITAKRNERVYPRSGIQQGFHDVRGRLIVIGCFEVIEELKMDLMAD
jgi:hypothetical protein